VSSWGLCQEIYLHSAGEAILHEKALEKSSDFLAILFEKCGELLLLVYIFNDRVMQYLTECDLPGRIDIPSAECFCGELLLDPEATDPMRDIGSPSENGIPARDDIVRVEESFIHSMKILLQFA